MATCLEMQEVSLSAVSCPQLCRVLTVSWWCISWTVTFNAVLSTGEICCRRWTWKSLWG